jgi:DNA (cytosine-5)-methyltransferase 1
MKMLSLFSGIGGIDLAAQWAGVEVIAFCEREPFCQKVLKKHWPDVPIFDDVKTLNKQALEEKGVDVGTIELISGGFPCQPFSIAGKRKGKKDDRDLWPEMFRIIEEIRPTWIVGENVANFVHMELDRTLFDLESIGYKGRAFVFPSSAIGTIHKRERTFIIAHSNSKHAYASKVETKHSEKDCRKEQKEWEQFFYINHGGNEIEFRQEDQSFLCRMDDGVPQELDGCRLRGLGNAVVPQQIYPIFKYIMEIERMNNQ